MPSAKCKESFSRVRCTRQVFVTAGYSQYSTGEAIDIKFDRFTIRPDKSGNISSPDPNSLLNRIGKPSLKDRITDAEASDVKMDDSYVPCLSFLSCGTQAHISQSLWPRPHQDASWKWRPTPRRWRSAP